MNSTDTSLLLLDVVGRWKRHGVANGGVTRREIDLVEQGYGLRLPQDFASLFLLADGMADGRMDDAHIRFWPIGELRPAADLLETDLRTHAGLFVFVDYLIWSHEYAIKLDNSESAGAVAIVGGAAPIPIASSFAQFLENYMRDPGRLFPP